MTKNGTIQIFRTHLEENGRTFYPGEAVCGQVILKIKSELKFRALRLQCHGEAYVNWPERSGTYTRYHHNKEQYFHTVASITGQVPSVKTFPDKNSKNSKNLSLDRSKRISAGAYSFNFKFIIPRKYLPPSFEGIHGYIRYWIRAVIERGFGKRDVKTKAARFRIGDFVGIDEFEDISESVERERTGSVGCFPRCTAGSLSISARTNKSAYEQGGTVQLSVSIGNHTSRHVTVVEVSLVQKTVYSDIEKKTKITENTVVSAVAGHVTRNNDVEFSTVPLVIPPRLIPTLLTCKCLSVCYCAKITVKLKRKLTQDRVIELPIIIASAPRKPQNHQHSSTETSALNETIETLDPEKRGTIFYVIGTPSPRRQKPLTPNKGRPHISFTATPSPYKYRTGIRNEAAVFCMIGSPVKYSRRVSLV